jgi:hypothetical protein
MEGSARDGQRYSDGLLAKLSLESKISLLTGADYWSLTGQRSPSGVRKLGCFGEDSLLTEAIAPFLMNLQ